jgi:SAM-dependent methyltransferase
MIFKNDDIPLVKLDSSQSVAIKKFKQFINEVGEVKLTCICGSERDGRLISEKDRYGIPCLLEQCQECGAVKVRNILKNNGNTVFYEKYYRDIYEGNRTKELYFKQELKRGKKILQYIQKKLDLRDVKSVMEIGCGAGGILKSWQLNGYETIGFDLGDHYFVDDPALKLIKGDFASTKKTYDLIILSHVLEHIEDPVKFLQNTLGVLKPKGLIYIEVPGVFEMHSGDYNRYFQGAHLFWFTKWQLIRILNRLGFEILSSSQSVKIIARKSSYCLIDNNPKKYENWTVIPYIYIFYYLNKFKINPFRYYVVGKWWVKYFSYQLLKLLGIK